MVANDMAVLKEPPVTDVVKCSPAWFRLVDQLTWYDRKSQHCQRWYKGLKFVQVGLAVLIPLSSLLPGDWAKLVSSIAGAIIALLEAIQQMNQYSILWFSYRATAEHLKHEKYLFLSGAGPYKGLADQERLILLAERVEEHVSTEHANWFNEYRRVTAAQKKDGGSHCAS